MKRTTKPPETKKTLEELVEEIRAGGLSDEDVRKVSQALGTGISEGIFHPTVGTLVKRAVEKTIRAKRRKPQRRRSSLEIIANKLNSGANDLMGFLDTGIKPEAGDKNHFKVILNTAPLLIMCFVQMGINIDEVMATVKGRKKGLPQ